MAISGKTWLYSGLNFAFALWNIRSPKILQRAFEPPKRLSAVSAPGSIFKNFRSAAMGAIVRDVDRRLEAMARRFAGDETSVRTAMMGGISAPGSIFKNFRSAAMGAIVRDVDRRLEAMARRFAGDETSVRTAMAASRLLARMPADPASGGCTGGRQLNRNA